MRVSTWNITTIHTCHTEIVASYAESLLHRASFYAEPKFTQTNFNIHNHNDTGNCSSRAGSQLQSGQKNDWFWSIFKKRKNHQRQKWHIFFCQSAIAALMQPLQYDLRPSAAKDNSITHAAAAARNLDAATPSTAICRDGVAKHKSTASTTAGRKSPTDVNYNAR